MDFNDPNFGQDFSFPNIDDPEFFQDHQPEYPEEETQDEIPSFFDDDQLPEFQMHAPKENPFASITQDFSQHDNGFHINTVIKPTPRNRPREGKPRYNPPKCPADFHNSLPPFPPPYENAQFATFRNITEGRDLVAKLNNLNDAYIAIPAAFIRRLRDKDYYTPIYGYLIHK